MEQLVFDQVVGPVVKFLSGHITKHLGYVICSTKHVNNMRKRMKDLEDASADVKSHMERNNINNKEIPSGVPDWLNDVENIKEKVESISSDGVGCLNMKMKYRVGRKACEDNETIKELITKNDTFNWTDAQIPTGIADSKPASSASSTPLVGDVFRSRDKPFNDALKFLQQDNIKSQVIALCGMGGIGKTTMMEQLERVANERKMFYRIVKVTIGSNPKMHSIQNDIAIRLGGEGLPEEIDTSRADSLCRRFRKILGDDRTNAEDDRTNAKDDRTNAEDNRTNAKDDRTNAKDDRTNAKDDRTNAKDDRTNAKDDKKKILVILDDVWEKVRLQDIGLTSPLPEGVKLLLTSRDSKICKQIAVDAGTSLHEVNVNLLEVEEANNFFFQITQVSKDDRDKYPIGCEIVKKCGCLPLAIRLIASALKFEEDYVWRDTRNRLMNNHVDIVQEVIQISYDHIKEYEEREIFLHCGLFPEDANISIEDLTTHAWGLKLLKNVSTLREARDRTKTSVQNLINANLLINGDHIGCVKMHDLVLVFVLGEFFGKKYPYIINHGDISKWSEDEIGESCKRISLTCRGLSEFPRDFKYPNLSLLLLMHGDESLKFSENFYENMENLEVIAYYEMSYPLLPRSLKCSTNLKALCLHSCKLMFDDCSFIGDLVNLEVLSFAHCAIRKLPATIANLRKLKLLDLTGCVDLHIDDGVFKNLESLEELYMRVSEGEGVRFTNASFEELKMLSSQLHALEVEFVEKNTWPKNFSFKKLDKFKISIGCGFDEYKYNEEYSYEKTLKLVTEYSSQLQDCKINEMFTKTEHLHLQVNDMSGLEDISIRPYGQRSFCSLIELEICKCVNLIYLFPMSVARGLKKLERLTVLSCSVLKALVQDDGREINSVGEMIKFEKLKFLSLEDLPKLEILFSIENVVELPQLIRLEVAELPNFTSIYPDKNNSCALLNSQVRISKLEELSIKRMENLKQIWGVSSEEDDNNISTLRKIWVGRCDSLVNLFPSNPMRLLDHLESLEVRDCRSIEVIFNIDLECVGQVELLTNSSLRSIYVYRSEKVREVWRIKGGENNYSSKLTCAFEALERIDIDDCKRFRNIFTPTNTNCKIHMPALTDMRISKLEVLSREERDDTMHGYDGVDAVFEMERSPAAGDRELVTTTNNQQPLLPNLQNLELKDMDSISHVWKCNNWKRILILQKQSSFQNLTTICILSCNRIKYLFSPLMAKLLLNLKKIDIGWCKGMEEVVSNRDDKDEEMTTTYTTTTFFPHLHSLSFRGLRNLKHIGGGVSAKSSTGITTHDQFESFNVTTIVPWSLCQYSREILINECGSLTEIFETQWIDNNSGGGITSTSIDGQSDTHNTSLVIPRPENRLVNLKKLVIKSCNLLKHVFTFSTLGSLKQLEELMINTCKAMEVIVQKENGEQRNVVDFPRLKSLELKNLPNLKGFFLGKNDFQWPSLEKVMIDYCPKIMVFTSGQSTALKLNYMHTSLGKHSLECGLNFHVTKLHQWSFHNLIELHMEWKRDVKYVIPSNELLHLKKLVRIEVDCSNVLEEVFEVEEAMEEGLGLELLFKEEEEVAMKGINSGLVKSQTVVEIPNLMHVELLNLWRLKYISRSNHHGILLKFSNLTTLSIRCCKSLEHVFTSSMVGSLQQLQDLHISNCPKMEVIVRVEGEEDEIECEAEVKKIVLPRLESLKLEHLESIKGFCLGKDDFSWPSLHTLEIRGCPEITVFSKGLLATPNLNIIDTTFGRCYIKEDEDLNSFIKTKQQEGFQL